MANASRLKCSLPAISALRNMGYGAPGDISVVGFDDISMASRLSVPLTTVSQDAFELGKAASQLLLERLEAGDMEPRSYTMPTQLRVRASTAAPTVGVEPVVET
ncbi:MAG: substrate-binding domain-containing protein [Chloroflexi bacterium]|nr:substrate-binding domain-containing protein [Chloroflexota bacterium]